MDCYKYCGRIITVLSSLEFDACCMIFFNSFCPFHEIMFITTNLYMSVIKTQLPCETIVSQTKHHFVLLITILSSSHHYFLSSLYFSHHLTSSRLSNIIIEHHHSVSLLSAAGAASYNLAFLLLYFHVLFLAITFQIRCKIA